MTKKSPHIDVEPEVLKWLRKSSGWTIDDVSKHLHVSTQLVSYWETGARQPTFNQIKNLARAYKRPSAAFFLAEPFEERPLPSDFRSFSNVPSPPTKKTLRVIRKARDLQSISSELMENLDIDINVEVSRWSVLDDVEKIARIERNDVEIPLDEQFRWKSGYEAFNRWREVIELKKIAVFQFPMEEIRGLSLTDVSPSTILVNSKDSIEARIFTLLHEYAHVLLHEPALCTPENPIVIGRGQDFERWCNNFAGEFLMPPEQIKQDFEQFGIANYGQIARKYRVSLSAILTRLLVRGLISRDLYESELNTLRQKELKEEQSKLEKKVQEPEEVSDDRGGGESLARRASRERGKTFISLVRENTHQGLITHSDALDYLNVKIKHLKELQI